MSLLISSAVPDIKFWQAPVSFSVNYLQKDSPAQSELFYQQITDD